MKDLLVIGGASLDKLHFSDRICETVGGAGMYTAVAAHLAGAEVSMFAPRPHPVPESLVPAANRVEWLGPSVPPAELPRFEIAHHGGGRTTLVNAAWGAEAHLSPEDLPVDLSGYRLVHISALASGTRQLEFVVSCRERGAKRISFGTYARVIMREADMVQAMFQYADIFFMNENEAVDLFGSVQDSYAWPGKLLFVTLGKYGARVVQGGYVTLVSAPQADEIDPTGSGDTFCGAMLAGLARGDHPVMASRTANSMAARMIEAIGPEALWSEVPAIDCHDSRLELNRTRISEVAELVRGLPDVHSFDFVGTGFPSIGDPLAIDFFFAATVQQFGFWETNEGCHCRTLLAPLRGFIHKGSDYLWHAYLWKLGQDSTFCSPQRQADLTCDDMLLTFRSDDGEDPMPAVDLHLSQARDYGLDMTALGLCPMDVVARANDSQEPLFTFLRILDQIGGYKEDPLRKKSALLAVILAGRPEKFLLPAVGEEFPPIIDYHLMRSCLRIGLVEVVDHTLRQALVERRLLQSSDEWSVRSACYDAIGQVARISGKSMAAVDWFFFNSRSRCPEMTDPECSICQLDSVCAHHKEMFQPVFRTVFY